jgi:hypothetical protein
MLGESDEFRRLRHAVEKAAGDRERAIRNVCRLYTVNRFDALPGAIRSAMLALLDDICPHYLTTTRTRESSGEKFLGCFPAKFGIAPPPLLVGLSRGPRTAIVG